jgi:hypothetical protein
VQVGILHGAQRGENLFLGDAQIFSSFP